LAILKLRSASRKSTIDVMREVEDGSSKPAQTERAEKRPYREEREEDGSDIHPSECRGSSQNTNDEGNGRTGSHSLQSGGSWIRNLLAKLQ
jgi:hypothetical protein